MRVLKMLIDTLFPPRDTEFLLRNLPPDALVGRMRVRNHAAQGAKQAVTLLDYRNPLVRAAVLENKFHGNAHAVRLLASALGHFLHTTPSYSQVTLIPIPLSRARRKERGYNQMEAVLRALPPSARVSVRSNLLTRVRATLPQTSLGAKERKRNVAGAFQVVAHADPDHTYIIVDDVMTTGATLDDACRALHAAGIPKVYGLALAHQALDGTLVDTGDVAEWSKVPHC